MLHIGNISFAPTSGGEGSAVEGQSQQLCALAAHYLQVDAAALGAALVERQVAIRGEVQHMRNTVDKAGEAAEALAKARGLACACSSMHTCTHAQAHAHLFAHAHMHTHMPHATCPMPHAPCPMHAQADVAGLLVARVACGARARLQRVHTLTLTLTLTLTTATHPSH